jgi:hypothetical protein
MVQEQSYQHISHIQGSKWLAEWGRWCVSTLGMSDVQVLEFVSTSINFGNNGYHVSIH